MGKNIAPLWWAMASGSFTASGMRGFLDGCPLWGLAFIVFGCGLGVVAVMRQERLTRAGRAGEG